MATPQLALVLRHIHRLAAGRCSPQRTDRQLVEDFSLCRDETAFAALVARHGPMVLRVCRNVLQHEQDAEDAFQATFLVLARNSGSIRKAEALAEWLHGVAYRTAMKAKRSAARRRNHEARLRTEPSKAVPSPLWDDVRVVLDEEIQHLPQSYRAAFVLCLLEGKSGPEAAKELGIREGTVWSRLNRARQRLQQQLVRRGIELSALLAAVPVANTGSKTAMPPELASATVRSGLLVAAGGTAAGVIPTHVATLAAGVTRAMFLTKAKFATTIVLTMSLLAGGSGIIARQALAGKPEAPQATASNPLGTNEKKVATRKEIRKEENEQRKELLVVRSRVVDPDGKPVPGAKLYLLDFPSKPTPPEVRVISGKNGRFEFAVPKRDVHLAQYYPNSWAAVSVLAVADGYGLAWEPAIAPEEGGERTLRLVRDDVPIQGRILDLQGKPIAGVTIHVDQLSKPLAKDLTPWLETLRHDKSNAYPTESKFLTHLSTGVDLAEVFPSATSDAQGRFQLKGIGRERLAGLRIEGPTIETKRVRVMTRPAETITAVEYRHNPKGGTVTYYGASFDHSAAPTRPIVGTVRDKDTGQPLAGVVIRSDKWAGTNVSGNGLLRTTTDREGRYQLIGMPKGQGNVILAQPAEGQPYSLAIKQVGNSPGLDPVTVDFALKRGVVIKGRVTDKVTGKPVRGQIEYLAFADNPYRKEAPNWTTNAYLYTHDDGTFEVVALPGRGLLTVRAWGDQYLLGVGADQIPGRDERGDYQTSPYLVGASQYHTLVEVNPAKDAESLTCNLIVDPGKTVTGTVLAPDGKPLAGARPFGLHSYIMGSWAHEALKSADFTVYGVKVGEPRRLMFVHEGLELAGYCVVRGDEHGSITVKLAPWATVTGRLVTSDGLPRADVDFSFGYKPDPTVGMPPQQSYRPDKDGKFRIEGLVPGLRYSMGAAIGYMGVGDVFRELVFKPGEIRDLGDVEAKRN